VAITPTITDVEQPADDYQWVPFSEAVAITGLSTATVYRRVREGVFLKDAGSVPTRYGIPRSHVVRATSSPVSQPRKREPIAGAPGDRDGAARDRRDGTDGYQGPGADSRNSTDDCQDPTTDSRDNAGDYQQTATDSRDSTGDYQQTATDSRDSTGDYQQTATDSRDSAADKHASNEWRDDLLAQIERIEADKQRLTAQVEASEARHDADLSAMQARVDSLLDTVAAKDERVRDLSEQLREAHVQSEVGAQEWARRSDELAHRIADLVDRQHEADARIIELQPVAEQVPMLQAAVDDRTDELEEIRSAVKRIEAGVISGPIFRLLDKNRRLRR
jgi:hypothetical protein